MQFNRVMIIDDNDIDIFICKKMIEYYNFANEIIIKKSCAKALDFLLTCNSTEDWPDLIFLDLFMPVQNGYDFLEAYSKKSNAIKNKCKIIILSVLINEKVVQELCKNNNVYKFFPKPINKDSINTLKELYRHDIKSIYENQIQS